MCDLAMDQHGSRFIQQRLEQASDVEKSAAVESVLPEVVRLSHDVFGNYVVQKFIEFATTSQRRALCQTLQNHVLSR